jgi:hypothetical protein
MKKLCTVTQDMDNMSKDQLKGAIHNIEDIANRLYVAFNELIKEHDDLRYDTVLCWQPDQWDADTFYLPSVGGGNVIIRKDRLDSLIRWKLDFFAAYGNLCLESNVGDGYVVFELVNNDRLTVGHQAWTKANKELQRSQAALYESMSKK